MPETTPFFPNGAQDSSVGIVLGIWLGGQPQAPAPLLTGKMASLATSSQHSPSWLSRYGLTLALVVAYLAMTLLVVEQNRVIESQQKLIRLLFTDSNELSALKIKNNQEQRQR